VLNAAVTDRQTDMDRRHWKKSSRDGSTTAVRSSHSYSRFDRLTRSSSCAEDVGQSTHNQYIYQHLVIMKGNDADYRQRYFNLCPSRLKFPNVNRTDEDGIQTRQTQIIRRSSVA